MPLQCFVDSNRIQGFRQGKSRIIHLVGAYLVVYVTTGASPGESTTNHVNRVSPLSYHTFGDISMSV